VSSGWHEECSAYSRETARYRSQAFGRVSPIFPVCSQALESVSCFVGVLVGLEHVRQALHAKAKALYHQ